MAYLNTADRAALAERLGMTIDKFVFYFDDGDGGEPHVYYHNQTGGMIKLPVDFSKFESWLAKRTQSPSNDKELLKKQGMKIAELTQKLKDG